MGTFKGTNFLSGHLSGKNTVGKKAWKWAKSQNFSDKQIKVAIQQLASTGIGVNNAPGQFFSGGGPMKGVPGMHHASNPMGKYQGSGGNFGLQSYNAAKAAGHAPQDIYSGAYAGGMFLPERAMAQYMEDITPLPPEPQEIPLPGTQTGAHNVNNYSAAGLRSPSPENRDLNTGGTTDAFGRKKLKPNPTVRALLIDPLAGVQ